MDASLAYLAGSCEQLSLSTNCIEKIANLNGFKNLRILSLGRNNIKVSDKILFVSILVQLMIEILADRAFSRQRKRRNLADSFIIIVQKNLIG